jgi:hypothetical protein
MTRLVGDARGGSATPLGYWETSGPSGGGSGRCAEVGVAVLVVGRQMVDPVVEVACDHAHLETRAQARPLCPTGSASGGSWKFTSRSCFYEGRVSAGQGARG